jgi:hypothetical protein
MGGVSRDRKATPEGQALFQGSIGPRSESASKSESSHPTHRGERACVTTLRVDLNFTSASAAGRLREHGTTSRQVGEVAPKISLSIVQADNVGGQSGLFWSLVLSATSVRTVTRASISLVSTEVDDDARRDSPTRVRGQSHLY